MAPRPLAEMGDVYRYVPFCALSRCVAVPRPQTSIIENDGGEEKSFGFVDCMGMKIIMSENGMMTRRIKMRAGV